MWEFDKDDELHKFSENGEGDVTSGGTEPDEDDVPNYMLRPRLDVENASDAQSLSSSPIKKVQFQVGGGLDQDHEDEHHDNNSLQLQSISQSNPTLNSRGEKVDYEKSGGGSTIPLLPAIAEETNKLNGGKGRPPPQYHPYHHSISMIDTVKFGVSSGVNDIHQEMYGFVELDVLTGEGDLGNREWMQTARWIKYEEDLEEGSGRWGRPHIASLSFHALIKLRQLIERDGIILLDLEEHDMPGIAYRVVEELSNKSLIRPDESPMLMRALLLKHRHVQEFDKPWFGGLRRINTSVASLQSLYDDKGAKNRVPVSADPCVLVRRNSTMIKTSVAVDIPNAGKTLQRTASGNYLKPPINSCPANATTTPGDYNHQGLAMSAAIKESCAPSEEDLKWIGRKDVMRRLLPNGTAEATMIMVGEFDALRKPIFVFVRLAEPQYMFNITEIPVPARFFSILLVPTSLEMDILEIGRSFGALMSNKHFNELALRANGRKNLLTGINEFLDDSIVLPPGDWDNDDLLPLHVLQSKSKAIRMRRLKKQFSFIKSNESFVDGITLIPTQDENEKKLDDTYDPFQRSGRLFGGMVNDIKKRFPYYWSDFTDAMNFQCFSTIVFMYFASIGLIITFAGLMGEKTHDMIGMSETLTATAVAGIIYSLIAGQPLIPMGPTGALLVFDTQTFNFCKRYDLEFLPLRAWISCWVLVITLIVVAFEGCVLVRWFTKFTQDIFAALTALLLIFESVDNLVEIYETHPLAQPTLDKRPIFLNIQTNNFTVIFEETTANPLISELTDEVTAQPNTALLSTILMLGTFFIGYFLKEFRNSVFLGEKTRRALGDFGVPIAILTMVFLDFIVTDTYTQKVKVPHGLQVTSPEKRGWLINPMGMESPFSMYVALGAIGPALLLFILFFMSQQICELLINSKERRLVKGSGFHFDLVIVAFLNIGSGFFGAPWLCCATVRAIGHVTALTVYSKNNPPGEKPSILKVHEQRVTNLAVSILVGCSVLLSPVLAFTPMAVLFGVFLYMGVTSLAATQLFERFSLFFIPVESHPQTPYVRRVPTWKMHVFTAIQLGCLGVLWAVKSIKAISLLFPLLFILLVPVRLQLKRIFSDNELEALDGKPPAK